MIGYVFAYWKIVQIAGTPNNQASANITNITADP